VTPERSGDFTKLAQLVLRHREDLTSCLVILNGWDEARAGLVQTLVRGGIICAPIVIGKGPAPAGFGGHWLESGHIARDLKRLPNQLSCET
jgi:hypothetical protein